VDFWSAVVGSRAESSDSHLRTKVHAVDEICVCYLRYFLGQQTLVVWDVQRYQVHRRTTDGTYDTFKSGQGQEQDVGPAR
jgi:hypothetical protein